MTALRFGWPIFRHQLLWLVLVWFACIGLFGLSMAVLLIPSPTLNRWDGAVALGTCGGLAVVQRQDGTTWLRVSSVRFYRVEDPAKLTCG